MKKSNLLGFLGSLIVGLIIGFSLQPKVDNIVVKRVDKSVEKLTVTRVIDGDTIVLSDGRHIRYLGIDTPELQQPFGNEATEINKKLVADKIVTLQRGIRNKDKYNRYLRYVYVNSTFVNAELISKGLATAYIFDTSDPLSAVFIRLEQYAKVKKRGMWK